MIIFHHFKLECYVLTKVLCLLKGEYTNEKINCFECNKWRKCVNLKISYIFYKTLGLSTTCSKSGNNSDVIFKQEESIDILKILRLIDNINLLRAMIAMNIFKLKKTDETRNYYNEEIKQNDLMSNKKKRFVQLWVTLNSHLFSFYY